MRLFGTGTPVDRNVIYENYGAGVMVTKDAPRTRSPATPSTTTVWPTGQIGIDLIDGEDDKAGVAPISP